LADHPETNHAAGWSDSSWMQVKYYYMQYKYLSDSFSF